jgi:hypothetical protein
MMRGRCQNREEKGRVQEDGTGSEADGPEAYS